MFDKVKEFAGKAASSVGEAVGDVADKVKKIDIGEVASGAADLGKAAASGIADAATSVGSKAGDLVSEYGKLPSSGWTPNFNGAKISSARMDDGTVIGVKITLLVPIDEIKNLPVSIREQAMAAYTESVAV